MTAFSPTEYICIKMYFYIDCLQRKGKFGLIWIAAFEHPDFQKRSTKLKIKQWNIEKSCDDILRYSIEGRENSPKMNLYVSSTLLSGLAKVFREKAILTLRDAGYLFMKWGEIARLHSTRDVQPRKLKSYGDPCLLADSLGYITLQKHHFSYPDVNLEQIKLMEKQRKQKRKASEEKQAEGEVSILDHDALIEILRATDRGLSLENVVDPHSITMEEVPTLTEIPAEQTFGGEALESLLPEVQDALQGKEPEIPELTLQPEVLETSEIPAPPAVKDTNIGPMEDEQQVPTIQVEQHEDFPEINIDRVMQEIFVSEEEEAGAARETRRQSRDNVTVFSINKINERFTQVSKLMRCKNPREDVPGLTQKKKPKGAPDWLIPEELRPAAHLIPATPWPPAAPEQVLQLPTFDRRPQQEFELSELQEIQEMRDGEQFDDSSTLLRPSLGSPTPKTQPRDVHIRGTPSSSPLGKESKRSYAESNIIPTLEPIAEAIVPTELLEMEELQHISEMPMQPTEELQPEEEKSPASKRARLEEKSSSSPSSIASPTRYENKLLSLLASHLANNEIATFRDLAPPSSTRRSAAAHLFSSLLDLEKKQILRTQQVEAFGDIFIYHTSNQPI